MAILAGTSFCLCYINFSDNVLLNCRRKMFQMKSLSKDSYHTIMNRIITSYTTVPCLKAGKTTSEKVKQDQLTLLHSERLKLH